MKDEVEHKLKDKFGQIKKVEEKKKGWFNFFNCCKQVESENEVVIDRD